MIARRKPLPKSDPHEAVYIAARPYHSYAHQRFRCG